MKQYLIEIIRQKWRLLIVILTLLLFNTVLGYVVSAYQLPSVADLQIKWNDLRRQEANAGKVDAATLFHQGTADLEKLKAHIPEKREFAKVLNDLYETAASSDVEIRSLSYTPTQIKEEALYSYKLTLSVSGSYAAVKSCLSDLQNNQKLLVVDSVTFSNGDPFVENVVMNLNITVYLREGV